MYGGYIGNGNGIIVGGVGGINGIGSGRIKSSSGIVSGGINGIGCDGIINGVSTLKTP